MEYFRFQCGFFLYLLNQINMEDQGLSPSKIRSLVSQQSKQVEEKPCQRLSMSNNNLSLIQSERLKIKKLETHNQAQDSKYQLKLANIRNQDRIMPSLKPCEQSQLDIDKPNPEQISRLIISSIILQDFKSYRGKQVIGPLHEQFTSIVGANGSGKSNLLESLIFVFGYKANWVRQTKLANLIHHSSSSEMKNKASVQVRFQRISANKISTKDVQELHQEFILKRTIFSSEVSKFYLNNKQTSCKDIRSKLKKEGIDLDNNRFMILQGEVQTISQMKPKGNQEKIGMLEYLQNIIGSDKHLQKIQQLITIYGKFQETKHQRGQAMKAVEGQVKSLIKPKQEALSYVKLQTTIQKLKNISLQIQKNKLQSEYFLFKQNLQALQIQKKERIALEKEKLKKQKQRINEIKVNKLSINKTEQQLTKYREKLKNLDLADKNLNNQLEFISQDVVKYRRKNQQFQSELKKIIEQSEKLKVQMPKATDNIRQSKIKLDEMKEKVSKFDRPEVAKDIRRLEKQIKGHKLEKSTLEEKFKVVQKQFEKFSTEMKVNDEKMKEKSMKIQEEEKILPNLSKAMVQAQFVLKDLKRNFQTHLKQQQGYRDQVQKINATILNLKQETKQKGTMNNIFSKIMEQKIPGVLGRLGDLGIVNSKYEQIIASCLGSRIDSIVARNLQAGEAVIDFLKKNKLGRVSCIILDKINEYAGYMRNSYEAPKKSVRLFDLIDVKMEEVRVAFYFVLNDTLYCQDSNLGIKLSMSDDRNRRRVISYNNNKSGFIIFQLNGLMNGCSRRKSGFEAKVKIQDTNRINMEIEELNKKKQSQEQKLKEIAPKIQSLGKTLKETENDIAQLKKQKALLQLSIKNSKGELEDLRKSNYSYLKDNSFEQKKIQNEKQMKDLREKITSLENLLKLSQFNLSEKQEEQKSLQSEQAQQLRKNYNDEKLAYQKQVSQFNNNKAILGQTSKRVQDLERQKKQLTTKQQTLQQKINKMKKEREEIEKAAVSFFSLIGKQEEELMRLNNLNTQMRILLEQESKQIKQAKQKLEEINHRQQDLKVKLSTANDNHENKKTELETVRKNYEYTIKQFPFVLQLEQIEQMAANSKENSGKNTALPQKKSPQTLESLLKQITPLTQLSPQKIKFAQMFAQTIQKQKQTLQQNFSNLPPTDISIIKHYKQKYIEYLSKLTDLKNIEKNQLDVREELVKKKQQRLKLFRSGFNIINAKLKEVYQYLTKGGDAQLEQIDTIDPFSDGINFSVRPYKKAWKQIGKLSGGEKTLSSLALILSLHHYRPNPIYFMDEIDAALDFRNVEIVANYLKMRTKNAQFIVISLRNHMFQIAQKLIGVYKIADCTNVVEWQSQHSLHQSQNQKTSRQEDQIDEQDSQISSSDQDVAQNLTNPRGNDQIQPIGQENSIQNSVNHHLRAQKQQYVAHQELKPSDN